jgi:DNA-binding Lrp family transcriptional regulator
MKGFYLSAGLVEDPQHCERIGPALWEFEWLIAHETREAGRVLNGAPITAKRIAASLGRHVNTVETNLARLEREKYIERFRQEREPGRPYGYKIVNSKKWVRTENCGNGQEGLPQKTVGTFPQKTVALSHRKLCDLPTENCGSYKEVDKVDILDSKNLCSNSGKPSSNEAIETPLFQSNGKPTPEPTPPVCEESLNPTPRAIPTPCHEAGKLAALLAGEIRRNAPNFRITPGQLRKWSIVADLMLRRDGRTYEQIAGAIQWAQADSFWQSNILSMGKLREKYDALELKAKSQLRGNGNGQFASASAARSERSKRNILDGLLESARRRDALVQS